MAPRAPPPPPGPAAANTLSQLRERTIRKPKLSKTPISDVFVKACQEGDFKKIRYCLNLDVDINSRGSDNQSALYHSIMLSRIHGNEKVFDFLIEHPDLDVDQINRNPAILETVSVHGREDQLRKICELPGIDVNAGNALYYAAGLNSVAAINILAENPTLDWNAGTQICVTPIGAAIRRGNPKIVERLLSEPSLDLGRVDFYGGSVALFAVEKYDRLNLNETAPSPVKCLELLSKDPRMKWNIRNENGETPIMVALKNKEMEMVKILMKTPGVDLKDIAKMREGNALLKEMLQKNEEENRQLPSLVPDCPVRISTSLINYLELTNEYLFPGLLQSVLSRLASLSVFPGTLCVWRMQPEGPGKYSIRSLNPNFKNYYFSALSHV